MPVTLSEAKAQLRLEAAFTTDDTYITSLISVAEAHVESYCNRRLITQTWEKSFESWERGKIMYAPAGLKLGLLGRILLLIILIRLPFRLLWKKLFRRNMESE